jgi:hypothetical protein
VNQVISRDDFEEWLFNMDDVLDEFIGSFPESERQQLNFTPESLDLLEQWILARYPNVNAMLDSKEAQTVDALARYIGETFRRKLGGHWDIRFDTPKYVYYGLPELRGNSKKSTPECPHTLATASSDRRTGCYLRTVLQNSKNFD